MNASDKFVTKPGFCSDCGSILPLIEELGGVKCYACCKEYPAEIYKNYEVNYTIHFNFREALEKNLVESRQNNKDEEIEGPVVDRKCPKCGNDKMSYATIQLRSADEGQTVFYTCTKCKFKESENS